MPWPVSLSEGLELVDVIVTDYGPVRISGRSLAWLDAIDKDWREISTSKRRRGKHANWVREQVRKFEIAVMVAAAIAWNANEDLQEF
jgi:hypothetical protein